MRYLNALSGDKYAQFLKIHENINKEIERILEYKIAIPVSKLTILLKDLRGNETGIAGGKIAHLGDIKSSLNLPVPDGFAISAYAFIKFMEHNKFGEKISEQIIFSQYRESGRTEQSEQRNKRNDHTVRHPSRFAVRY